MDPSGQSAPANVGPGAVQRRLIYFGLIALFMVQTALTWTRSTEVPPGLGTLNETAQQGRQLFLDFNCTACHQFYGLGGHMGPDLTNVTRTTGKGAAYARGIILHGTERMPMLGVTPEQADAIVAYLEAWASSGTYPVRGFNPTPYGTYLEMHNDDDQ
jgi:nitric oxide reductase subunit C